MSKCRYCNSTSYGHCSTSPSKKHEHMLGANNSDFDSLSFHDLSNVMKDM